MTKNRLEAFSDGVLAIVITIMVLEIKVPRDPSWSGLTPLIPKFLSYALSFAFVGIYWNNHHHMLAAVDRINGKVLWANHHLLFWLSLIPFATGWMGENDFRAAPVAAYGAILLLCGLAYQTLARALAEHHGPESLIGRVLANDRKGRASLVLYVVALALSLRVPAASLAIYVAVAIMWFVPDHRFERELQPNK